MQTLWQVLQLPACHSPLGACCNWSWYYPYCVGEEGSIMGERRWEDTLRVSLTDIWSPLLFHCSVCWFLQVLALWIEFATTTGFLAAIIISQLTNDFILEKEYISQDQKQSTASMTLRTFLCLLNERISILMTSFMKCFLILNFFFFFFGENVIFHHYFWTLTFLFKSFN